MLAYNGDLLYVRQAIDRFVDAADHNFKYFPVFNREHYVSDFFEF